MKVDPLIKFVLPTEVQAQITPFLSPEQENSIFKQVPLSRLEEFKGIARVLNLGPIRVKYRGPRYDSMRMTTLKRNARHATIYPK